jgi:hypothetical protein
MFFYNIFFIMSRKINRNIIFNLRHVTNYSFVTTGTLRIFQSPHYRYKLDTIFYLSLDPPREKLYRLKKRVFLPYELSIGGF